MADNRLPLLLRGTAMNRRTFLSFLSALALIPVASASLRVQNPDEISIRYVSALQNADGGFRATQPEAKSELKNTPAATRAIHYFKGKMPNQKGIVQFVQGLYDPAAGGFHEPGAPVDVRSTAMGLMSLAELKQKPNKEQAAAIATYFDQNAKTLADIYIAEAALFAADLKPLHPENWLAAFKATQKPDGSFGDAAGDTARAAITYFRLKVEPPNRAGIVTSLKSAQKSDGAFGIPGMPSDLGTSYPIMRAFFLLKEKPDIGRMWAFVKSCRNSDGGYGPSPGKSSSVGSTYYASIILYWIDEMEKWQGRPE